MTVFHSKYRELSFYVDGELFAFSSGSFSTDDEKVIAVLEKMSDALCVDEPKPSANTAEPVVTTESPTEDKAPTKRKSSAK